MRQADIRKYSNFKCYCQFYLKSLKVEKIVGRESGEW